MIKNSKKTAKEIAKEMQAIRKKRTLAQKKIEKLELELKKLDKNLDGLISVVVACV